jgi:hypothetical protein
MSDWPDYSGALSFSTTICDVSLRPVVGVCRSRGHLPHLEMPERFKLETLSFLKS